MYIELPFLIFFADKMKPRPDREWDYMPPHVCKYCQRRFYNKLSRYLFHIRQHEKWIRPYWYKSNCTRLLFTSYNNTSRSPYKTVHQTSDIGVLVGIGIDNHDTSLFTLRDKTTAEMIHTKEKPHQCTYCNKSFSRSGQKTNHERIHTKKKPYECTYCNKSFSDASSKTKHERIHTKRETI